MISEESVRFLTFMSCHPVPKVQELFANTNLLFIQNMRRAYAIRPYGIVAKNSLGGHFQTQILVHSLIPLILVQTQILVHPLIPLILVPPRSWSILLSLPSWFHPDLGLSSYPIHPGSNRPYRKTYVSIWDRGGHSFYFCAIKGIFV